VKVPRSVSTICPYCGEKVNFALTDHNDDGRRLTLASTGACPACNRQVHFWTVRQKRTAQDFQPVAVFMHPPATNHYAVPDLSPSVPATLRQAFESTIDSLNTKNYTATATGARRTLEGIFKHLAPEDAKRLNTLAPLIDAAMDRADLAKPLRTLAHGIRDGGNLGAHFDPDNEPSAALARQMVELLGYLISYLYVLPQQIENLEQSLGGSRAAPPQPDEEPPA
jgi:hypothetical protein